MGTLKIGSQPLKPTLRPAGTPWGKAETKQPTHVLPYSLVLLTTPIPNWHVGPQVKPGVSSARHRAPPATPSRELWSRKRKDVECPPQSPNLFPSHTPSDSLLLQDLPIFSTQRIRCGCLTWYSSAYEDFSKGSGWPTLSVILVYGCYAGYG